MSDTTLLALFEDIDPAAEGIEKLHEMGVSDDQITVISGVPVPERLLGRPRQHTYVPRMAIGRRGRSASCSACSSTWARRAVLRSMWAASRWSPSRRASSSLFEMTMLFMLLSTFIGLFINSNFPSYAPTLLRARDQRREDWRVLRLPDGEMREHSWTLSTALGAESVSGWRHSNYDQTWIDPGGRGPCRTGGLLLFAYDIVKVEWISFMEIQPSYKPMEDPLPPPPDSIPVEGPAYIPGDG